jgi:AbrB family looped-hinge helix DNA binding protein
VLAQNVLTAPIIGDGWLKEKETKFTIYVGKDGRITVPKGVRDALGIREGDLVECAIRKIEPKKPK